MIAIIYTVKNEALMLEPNYAYHRALGVEQFFIVDDGCGDSSVAAMQGRPGVTILTSEECRAALRAEPHYGTFHAHAEHELNARKCLNAHYAAMLAKQGGCDWLINIDPDEFLFVGPGFRERELVRFLESVPERYEMVVFPNYEAMQRTEDGPFWAQTVFKSLFVQVGNSVFQTNFRRRVTNPFAEMSWWVAGYYGHSSGKSAVRLNTSNRWLWHASGHWATNLDGSPLKSFDANDATGVHVGLAHFFCVTFQAFVEKFRNYAGSIPDRRINNRANLPTKATWISVVNNGRLSEREMRNYFNRSIAIEPSYAIEACLDPLGGGVIIESIRDGLASCGFEAPRGPQFPEMNLDCNWRHLGSHMLLSWRRRRGVM